MSLTPRAETPAVSIVIPGLNEAESLPELSQRIDAVLGLDRRLLAGLELASAVVYHAHGARDVDDQYRTGSGPTEGAWLKGGKTPSVCTPLWSTML